MQHMYTISNPRERQRAFVPCLSASARHFAHDSVRDPYVLGFALFYIVAKFSVNAFYYHSGIVRAVLSPLIGLLFLTAAVVMTNAISLARAGQTRTELFWV